jgi:hypothetical protein
MEIKVRLTVTGQTPPNRTRSLIQPKVLTFNVAEKNVDAFVKKIDKTIARLEALKDLLTV